MRRWFALLLAVTLLATVLPTAPSTLAQNKNSPCVLDSDDLDATIAPEDRTKQALDGRLGGQRASWDKQYGAGEATPDSDNPAYEFDGCGPLTGAQLVFDRVVSVSLYADRPEDIELGTLSEPSEANWSQEEALAIAWNILPKDAERSDAQLTKNGNVLYSGKSEILGTYTAQERYDEVEASGEVGDLQLILYLDEVEEVYAIDVQLGGYGENAPDTLGFGMTWGEFAGRDGAGSCGEDEYFSLCEVKLEDDGPTYFTRVLPLTEDEPILRMSIEGLGGTSPADARKYALLFAPRDAELIGEATWSDGTIYETYSSDWLAETFADDSGIWAGEEPGTFALVIQQKLGKNEIARSTLTFPIAAYSEEVFEKSPKGPDRTQCLSRVFMDGDASVEGRLLAFERIAYEALDLNPDCTFSITFAYTEGSEIDSASNVGRAAVSLDGKGFSSDEDTTFLIKNDDGETFQVAINEDPGQISIEIVYDLAK